MPERIDYSEGRRLFGLDPDGYDEARPRYPSALYDFIVDAGAIRPATCTLEIGAGSGLATSKLIELGADPLTILEPDRRFAPRLEAIVAAHAARCTVVHAAFEELETNDSFDLIAAATAFHWVQPDVGVPKLVRLLRSRGWVALWWNVLQVLGRPDAFHDSTHALLRDLAVSPTGGPETLPFPLDRAAREADFARTSGFEPARYFEMHWTHVLDARGIGKLYEGFSHIQRLDTDARERLLDALMEIADREFGGRVERNVTSVLYLFRRKN
jgi:trans-aconitate methyltransferase